ncbi:flagellar export protein FliJ [Ectothiorhodospiraceae bacterium WFHF3C12]|nr:flagellar export protein FliJ [Ectothiorhodospiraceae bacterium WFHF3C12]
MTRSKRLEPVQRIAEERSSEAGRAYGERQKFLQSQVQRLEQLEQFRDDYKHGRTAAGEAGMDAYRLRDYNAFIARIEQAIKQQRELVRNLESEVEQLRRGWMEQLSHSRALDSAVDRMRGQERRDRNKREQALLDELAQRRIRGDLE